MSAHREVGAGRAGALLAIAALLTILASKAASQQIDSSMPLYQLHGSGTSNPGPLIQRVMDIMMARTKPKIAMSYRSIGSGAGGTEFTNYTSSAFGCGDVPISPANFNTTSLIQNKTMMHVPFLVGTVSVFYNIPGIGEGLYLSPCTLAKIFRGAIVQWNDPDIVNENSDIPDLTTLGKPIHVVHRNSGSSSTYALTHYFARTCPEQWNRVAGATSIGPNVTNNRDVGVTTQWPKDEVGRWKEVQNSQQMAEAVSSVPYSLGYVESGQGLQAGLQEVTILGPDNVPLTSSTADKPAEAFWSQFPLSDLTSFNWTRVNPVFGNATTRQWPLTLGTYFYVRTDLGYLNETGGLLRLFINYMLSDDVASLLPEYGFIAMPKTIRDSVAAQVNSTLTGLPQQPNWVTETATDTIGGQRNFVFSSKRDTYLMSSVVALQADNRETKSTLKLGDAYQVHGSGSFVSALMLRHAMQILQSRARVPVSLTYRAVGSVEAQREFAKHDNMIASYNHFKVGDMPLDPATWSGLNASLATNSTPPGAGEVLQIPFALSALGIYHSKSVGRPSLALNCTALARLFSGGLTSWADPLLRGLNQGTGTIADEQPGVTITVFAMAAPSGATYALSGYLAKACGADWSLSSGPVTELSWPSGVTTKFGNVNITTPEQMLAAIAGTPNAVGYLPVTLGATSGLAEARLAVPGAGTLLSAQADLSRVVTQARSEDPAIFSSAFADVATVLGASLYGLPNTWPMPMVQYIYMYRNLSGYGYSGPLLRAFVEFLIPGNATGEGSLLATSSGLTPMPEAVQQAMRGDVGLVTLRTMTVAWESESAGLADGDAGAALYTFSANRQSYDAYQLGQLQGAVKEVQGRLATGLPAVVRVACTADTYGYIRLLRRDVEDMATSPIRILDEMGTAADIVAMLKPALNARVSAASAPVQLIVHPGPLSNAAWTELSLLAPVLQIPASIRPVAVLYKGAEGLRLGLCTLAGVLSGKITRWDDPAIKRDNPSPDFNLTSTNTIKLLTAGVDDGDVLAVVQYIRRGAEAANCPEHKDLVLAAPPEGLTADPLAALMDGAAYSGLALLAASTLVSDRAAGQGLQAAALPSSDSGSFVTPLQTPQSLSGDSPCAPSGCPGLVGQNYTAAVESIMPGLSGVPAPDPTGSWSGVALTPLTRPDVYPVVRFDVLVLPADVSKFGEVGAALQAVVKYATRQELMVRMQQALAPYFSGLGDKARQESLRGVEALQASPYARGWAVASSSADQVTDPATTIVLSRAPSLLDVALAGSQAGSLATGMALSTSIALAEAMAVAQGEVQGETLKLQRDLTALQQDFQKDHDMLNKTYAQLQQEHESMAALHAQLQRDMDKLDLTYRIAVAALVLGLVLSVAALAAALYALSVVRSGGGGGGGGGAAGAGCFGTPGAKYEPQPGLEMRMLP